MSVFKASSLNVNTPHMRRSFLALALGLTLSGCLGYEGTVDRGYMQDAETLEQIKPGMAAEKVLSLLGTPSTTSTVGGDAWYYISQKVERKLAFMRPQVVDQRVLAVYFNSGKKVERIANYGLEDGKVFDFISRTTPTGGAEPSFIHNMLKGLFRFS
jgi:outer membrane protein assembly factor BamE (lipoprotein component of BamABCDE complex)